MEYIEVNLKAPAEWHEQLVAALSFIDYEGFVEEEQQLKAYIPLKNWSPERLQEALQPFEGVEYTIAELPNVNWNEVWERSYEPVWVEGRCFIRASFHEAVPQAEYEIVITPKMAFGTGHHPTTGLMLAWQLELPQEGKKVLDAGCGTAILSIMAEKRGAQRIDAYDIDDWAVENALENVYLNRCERIFVQQGTVRSVKLEASPYDLILANINRNVLLDEMPDYARHLVMGGDLLLSGFLADDMPLIRQAAEANGLVFVAMKQKNEWVSAHFIKKQEA
ncbi:MAG: ribosomal protein L11 methyltransferase [Thermonema sp.]|uniref:50S ribosomal protein L11 methyltransferase n=1 Tax=Thermonema sp. TaxID=2231181 RepID=UPI0021DDD9B0|nr:50S ribosomal protein L11 methyltransferase [Thermonema sp.]GIV40166.1 MAG: ribosomal protein L11 methyltransferase [Thermonema sp.]